jgi:multimeric flavodoxin WrbA
MQIVVLLGSPRKNGSTARLVNELLKGVEKEDTKINIHHLNDLNIKWCQSCHKCITMPSATCAIQDDVNKILEDISAADAVIFGTPIYMASMTGQMKTLLDRMRPFMREDDSSKMKPGKKAIWVVTQRNPDGTRYLPVFEKVMFPMKVLGFIECKTLIASGTPDLQDLLKQEETLEKARTLGTWLAG